MLADTLKIQLDGDTSSGQDIFRSDTTMHQDIWASNRTSSQYNLLANINGRDRATFDKAELNPSGSQVVIKEDLSDSCIR